MKRLLILAVLGYLMAITPRAIAAYATIDPINPYPAFIYPAHGILTSGYGWRWGRLHQGIDIAAPTGTPIVASAEGQVAFAGWHSGGYGNMIDIKHMDGSTTRYAHNSRLLVKAGDPVAQGEVIALMGSTGRATGPHCHFELHTPTQGAVNPIAYLDHPQPQQLTASP